MMKYKEYFGHVVYDDQARLFHGEVIGLNAVITFQGTNVDELEKAFKDSVNDYLEWCQERGKSPEKTFSGNLRVRLTPQLHADLSKKAFLQGVSLNSYIIEKLKNT
jgi:predicted HicB family RNase H-like nuclease